MGTSGTAHCAPKVGSPGIWPTGGTTFSTSEKEISALCRPQWATSEREIVPSKADHPSAFASKSVFAIRFSSTPGGGIGSHVDTSIPMSIVPGPNVRGIPVV